jgi:glycosyltransferase involved in cell wall biosynthesis
MHALLTDPAQRARMARNARVRATEVFSLEATGRRFLDWYDRALAQSERA